MKRTIIAILFLSVACFAQNQSATKQLTIKVLPTAPVITNTSLPDATVGKAYTATLTVSGGAAPYSWSVTQGTMPAGLSLTPSTGTIAGIPTGSAGSTAMVFQVTDSSGSIATIKMQWQASPSQVAGYNIMRGLKSGGAYTQVTSTAALNASDAVPRKSGDTYFYVVQAFNSAGAKSIFSNEAKAVIP